MHLCEGGLTPHRRVKGGRALWKNHDLYIPFGIDPNFQTLFGYLEGENTVSILIALGLEHIQQKTFCNDSHLKKIDLSKKQRTQVGYPPAF